MYDGLENVTKPHKSFMALECFFGEYSNKTFYLSILLKILVPYLLGVIIFIIWLCFMKKKVLYLYYFNNIL
jgi:hypothetical protein